MEKRTAGYKWNIIRNVILERDNHTCQVCREKKEHLEVHHKTPIFLGGSPEPSNLISLCHSCHMKVTMRYVGGSEKNPYRVFRRLMHDGTVQVFKPKHPRAAKCFGDGKGFVLEHILIGEQKIGRLLAYNEKVYHKNGIKHDNRLDNLVILTVNEYRKLGRPIFGSC